MPGFYAGIDEKGRLFEMGWTKWPTLMHLAWQVDGTRHRKSILCGLHV